MPAIMVKNIYVRLKRLFTKNLKDKINLSVFPCIDNLFFLFFFLNSYLVGD